jgi:sigma-B regulation protein RsbU (phosphoserine phosphatase)
MIALGDVMGHGVAAALVMAGVRAVLHDRLDSPGGLSELAGRLNNMLAADQGGDRFMTMHLSVLDPRTATFRWVSAGHDPAFIFDPATNKFDENDAGGPPLGVMSDMTFDEFRYEPLRVGQVITVGTDGVWEMPNPAGEQFGKDRLREVIRASANGTADEISRAILKALSDFQGDAKSVDDVTFVVVKVIALGASLDAATNADEKNNHSK